MGRPPDPVLKVSVEPGKNHPVRLVWSSVRDALYYRVLRDERKLAETPATYFPDVPPAGDHRYTVEAFGAGGAPLGSGSCQAHCTAPVPPETSPSLQSIASNAGVLLRWDSKAGEDGIRYEVLRRPKADGKAWSAIGYVRPYTLGENLFRDVPGPGDWVYGVRAVDTLGQPGPVAETITAYDPKPMGTPLMSLGTAWPVQAEAKGDVRRGASGIALGGGHIRVPHEAWMNFTGPRTINVRFRQTQATPMPVILSHGVYQNDGWYLQVLGGRLVFMTPDAQVAGPLVLPGETYDVTIEYDGYLLRLVVNGETHPPRGLPFSPTPARRDLRIGTYESDEDTYRFIGQIEDLAFHDNVAPATR